MAQPLSAPLPASVEHLTKPRPLVFPTDATVPESTNHLELRTALYFVLCRVFATTAWIGSDQFVYFDASDPSRSVAHDVFVRRGGPDEHFASWKVWERGAPELAIEIVSESDRSSTDWQKKLAKYHALGVVELVRFEADAATPLRVWDRVDGDLVERRLLGSQATSHVLAIELVVVGNALRIAKDGVILLTPDELALREAERAEAEAERAAGEAERANAEAERADAEARRAERLRAQLVAAGIDPEE